MTKPVVGVAGDTQRHRSLYCFYDHSCAGDQGLDPLLTYLATAHRANPDAEVSGPELQAALGLETAAVRAQVAQLARQGLVEWDPLLSNLWIRITDKGLAAVEDAESRPGPR